MTPIFSVREIVERYQEALDLYRAGGQFELMPPEYAAPLDAWQPRIDALGATHLTELDAIAGEGGRGAIAAALRAKKIREALAADAFAAARVADPVAAYADAFERGEIARMIDLGVEKTPVVLGVYERALDAMDRVPHARRQREVPDARSIVVAINALLGERDANGAPKSELFARMIAAPGWVGEVALARALCAREPVPGLLTHFASLPDVRRRAVAHDVARLVPNDVKDRGLRLLVRDVDRFVRRDVLGWLGACELHWDRLANDPDRGVREVALSRLDAREPETRARIAAHVDAAPQMDERILWKLAESRHVPWCQDPKALRAAQWAQLEQGLEAMGAAIDLATRRLAAAEVHAAIVSIGSREPALDEAERLVRLLAHPEHARIARSIASSAYRPPFRALLQRELEASRREDGVEDAPHEMSLRAMTAIAWGTPTQAIEHLGRETRASVRLHAYEVLLTRALPSNRDALVAARDAERDPVVRAAADRVVAALDTPDS